MDVLQQLNARESLVVPLSNLAELYIQGRRFGEAERASQAALRISQEVGDEKGSKLATFRLGLTEIYLRQIASRQEAWSTMRSYRSSTTTNMSACCSITATRSARWVRATAALTIYEKAGAVSLAAWRKERQLSYQALQRAYESQKKQNELTALHHESALKAAELQNERRLKALWVALSVTTLIAAVLIAILYRRVAKANKSLH